MQWISVEWNSCVVAQIMCSYLLLLCVQSCFPSKLKIMWMFVIKWISVREKKYIIFCAVAVNLLVPFSRCLSQCVQLHLVRKYHTKHTHIRISCSGTAVMFSENSAKDLWPIGLERAAIMATFPIYDDVAFSFDVIHRRKARASKNQNTFSFYEKRRRKEHRRIGHVHVHRR